MGCLESILRTVFHFTWCVGQGITCKVILQAVVDPYSQETIFLGRSAMQGRPKMDPPAHHRPAIECGSRWPGSLLSASLSVGLFPSLGPPRVDAFPRTLAVLKHRARAVTAQVFQNHQVFVVNVW